MIQGTLMIGTRVFGNDKRNSQLLKELIFFIKGGEGIVLMFDDYNGVHNNKLIKQHNLSTYVSLGMMSFGHHTYM